MASFFTQSTETKKYFDERQKYIKETLIYSLSENLKECEYIFKANPNSDPLDICDASNSLCTTLEAIFLHGLKEDWNFKLMSLMDTDVDRRPSPSFWSFVCVFLHKGGEEEIRALAQVKTNVGYCRVFIRSSLNDFLLSSYFKNIRSSRKILKNHYQSFAFLCDNELVETAENLLLGIESYVSFKLPLNSSLLNSWNDAPLSLAGIYNASLRSAPLAYGEDAASAIPSSNTGVIEIPSRNSGIPDIYQGSISNSIFSSSPVSFDIDADEDESLSRILREADETEQKETNEATEEVLEAAEVKMTHLELLSESNVDDVSNMNESVVSGNSILNKQSWSEPVENLDEEQPDDNVNLRRSHSIMSNIEEKSYMTLFNEKQRRDTASFKEVWEKFQKSVLKPDSRRTSAIASHEQDEINPEDFEVVQNNNPKDEKEIQELQHMVELLCRLSNEVGLDAQGFLCNGCKVLLGIELAKASVCHFDGHYYCSHCISNDKFQIPSKIIYNWDFKYYTISKRAETFLIDYQFKPFIDFKILNPVIYSYIDQMNRLQKLRIQLNYIRAYIFTCSESAMNEMQKLLYGKEYIYESIHLYSISDLSLIYTGALEEMLKKIVVFGKDHCLKCALCSVKGFICEYCRKSRIIYPFDVDDTYRCNNCSTVSHLNCYNPVIPCPKCERKKRREMNEMVLEN